MSGMRQRSPREPLGCMVANVRALSFFLAAALLSGVIAQVIGAQFGFLDAGRFGFAIGGGLALWYAYRKWLRPRP